MIAFTFMVTSPLDGAEAPPLAASTEALTAATLYISDEKQFKGWSMHICNLVRVDSSHRHQLTFAHENNSQDIYIRIALSIHRES